ncbi:MAG: CRTAC1 family protein [Planctomycetota bacterium]|nr:MAG: CRTAC1 family protein [Planctomycetota bacterium]
MVLPGTTQNVSRLLCGCSGRPLKSTSCVLPEACMCALAHGWEKTMKARWGLIATSAGALILFVPHAPAQTLWFTNVTDDVGATFTPTRSPRYGFMGAGGLAADFNNDGYADLFLLGGPGRRDALFINNGLDADGNFSFTDEAEAWGLPEPHHSFSCSAADFNNDGLLDLFITSYGPGNGSPSPGYHKLYRNNGPDADGNWSFTDIAAQSGCNLLVPGLTDGTGSAWGDYDLDGDLDLLVACYHRTAFGNRLYRNDGPDGFGGVILTDVTDNVGIRSMMAGFVPGFVDMNHDRYPELLMVADTGTSHYFVNNGDGTFSDQTPSVQDLSGANGMGSAVGDLNSDGLLDWYVSGSYYDFLNGPGNLLLIQNPDGTFNNIAPGTPVQDGGWGWGVLMVDLNHDRLIDLVETNGFGGEYGNEQSYLYFNRGNLVFEEVALDVGFVHTGEGRGLLNADFDNDGDEDLVVIATGEPVAVYENHLLEPGQPEPDNAHWLRIEIDTRARDSLSPFGMHTLITLVTGNQHEILVIDGGFNHSSQGEIGAHAGLGNVSTVDYVRFRFSDGSYLTLANVNADQILRVNAPFNPADYDNSGTLDFLDVMAFINGYMSDSLTSDHNGDWTLDVYDLLAFLNDFVSN